MTDFLKNDDREVVGSIIVIAGPKRETHDMWKELKPLFEKYVVFDVTDDYGEFPDTQGYTAKQFSEMESSMEDPALFPFMTKCLDAVMEYNASRVSMMDKLGYHDIEGFIHTPKFGGKIFAVVGMVRAYKPRVAIVQPKPITSLLKNIVLGNQN